MTDTLKILAIDDSEDDLVLYRRALGKSGHHYSILEAGNGEEGLEHIALHNPDCVLLDYSLPGRNGLEVLKRIRSRYPFVAVVMMTGQGNENVAVTAIKEGAQDYLNKSTITADSLQRTIRAAIEYCALQKRIKDQKTSLEIFSHALAHDLKEPVNTVNSFLDLLIAHETLSDRGQGYLNYAKNAAARMSALIESVYFYARLDGVNHEITKTACDVTRIFNDTKENLASLILERKAIIICDSLPDNVYANRVQLTQILQNLIANAIHYSEADPVVRLHVDDMKDHWKFSLADNGPGINADLQDKIFEPFKRLSGQKGNGLGLGLAICKKIIESHHGNIWYEFGKDGGTTFFFTLPKPETAAKSAGAALPVHANAPTGNGNHALATILLVEDNEADIELTRIMLIEEAGLQCNMLVAGNALEALAILQAESEKRHAVDLILLDINMPGIDGFELMERIRADETLRHLPIVMCTTSDYGKDIEKAKVLGAKGYVTKPAELKKLQSAIGNIETIRLCQENSGYVLLRVA